jgi:hypothetical protein
LPSPAIGQYFKVKAANHHIVFSIHPSSLPHPKPCQRPQNTCAARLARPFSAFLQRKRPRRGNQRRRAAGPLASSLHLVKIGRLESSLGDSIKSPIYDPLLFHGPYPKPALVVGGSRWCPARVVEGGLRLGAKPEGRSKPRQLCSS